MTGPDASTTARVPGSWTGLGAGALAAAVLLALGLAVAVSFLDLEAAWMMSQGDWLSALGGLMLSVALYALILAGARWPANRTPSARRWFPIIAAAIPCLLNLAAACLVLPDFGSEYAGWWALKLAVYSIVFGAPALLGAVAYLRIAGASPPTRS